MKTFKIKNNLHLKKANRTLVPGVKKKLLFLPNLGVSKIPQLITRLAFCCLIFVCERNQNITYYYTG